MKAKPRTLGPVFFDSFSGSVAELKPSQRNASNVLRGLTRDPRISTFDLSEKPWLQGCIETLKRNGHITEDKSESYPWHRFDVTNKGLSSLKGGAA